MKRTISVDTETNILIAVREDRFASIVDYAARGDSEGRWVDKQVQFSTNRTMLTGAMLELLLFFPMHYCLLDSYEQKHGPSNHLGDLVLFLVVSLALLLLAIGIRNVCVRVFTGVFRPTEEQLRLAIKTELTGHPGRAFRYWRFFLFFTPFSYRYIWWWTLIVGITSAEMEYFVQLTTSADQHVALHPSDLGISFMRALIISVIAYIATNIIRELLYLREHYIEGKVEAEKLSQTLKDVSPTITRTYGVLAAAVGVLGIGVKLQKFTKALEGQDAALHDQSRKFLENVSGTIDNFVEQLEKSPDNNVKLWLRVVLNRYIQTQREILNTDQKRILTLFSDLARITRELVGSTHPLYRIDDLSRGLEFFALLVIPPVKFLNFKDKEYIGDTDWESYLMGNILHSSGGVRQNRYFLSIDAKPTEMRNASEEAIELLHDEVGKQLRWYVQVKDDQIEVSSNDRRSVKIPCTEEVDVEGVKRRRYVIREHKGTEGEWQSLSSVIGTIYHVKGSCYVREFSKAQYESNLIDDKGSQKPLDYFAIKKDGVWKLCLQTRYDKSFDVAYIDIFHEGMDDARDGTASARWEELKLKLDKIFPRETPTLGKISSIEAYGEQ
jgi:hypothetical protein